MEYNSDMMKFKKFLTEAKLGDCFQVAGRAMIKLEPNMEKAGYKLVHAYVQGEGELEGRRFGHAFNMLGDVVFDNSNGNNIVVRKEGYFEQGGINPKEKGAYVEYNAEDSLLKMAKHQHYGPWDLDMSLEEEIPDNKREIGKKKIRISSKELNIIKSEIK